MRIINDTSSLTGSLRATLAQASSEDVREIVGSVMEQVRNEGDSALLRFEERFDHVSLSSLRLPIREIRQAETLLPQSLKEAIQTACHNITTFHAAQRFKPLKVKVADGVTCEQRAVPIERVGLYVPGGTAPLFSTVLMLAIPARLAGCKRIILCSPPNREGKIHPAILYAAQLAGVKEIYRVGGAQAIAAMTYGTQAIPRVDKIFGPGNQYVTAAKQLATLNGVAIDMPAGPSEVAILADNSARADFVAADLLSQAEHGTTSQVLLLTTSERLLKEVPLEVEKQLAGLPRRDIARQALAGSAIVLVGSLKEGIRLVNEYAPEHLILALRNSRAAARAITTAGSIFLGHLSCESAGDYASGTNHTLPTSGYARAYSALNLLSFMRLTTVQSLTHRGVLSIGPAVVEMARAEGLEGHARAMQMRLNALKHNHKATKG